VSCFLKKLITRTVYRSWSACITHAKCIYIYTLVVTRMWIVCILHALLRLYNNMSSTICDKPLLRHRVVRNTLCCSCCFGVRILLLPIETNVVLRGIINKQDIWSGVLCFQIIIVHRYAKLSEHEYSFGSLYIIILNAEV